MKFTLITAAFVLFLGSVHANFAFYAYMSKNVGPIGLETNLVFDKVLTGNSLSAYDSKTGKVTIPVDGVYEIGINIMEQKNRNAAAVIYVNTKHYCGVWIQTTPKDKYFIKRSNKVVLSLKAGNKVFVKTRSGDNLKAHYFYGNSILYTNFYVIGF